MRVFVMTVTVLFNYILQSTLFTRIEILSVKPDSALAVVVCYAILRGDVEGAILGFFTGILQDLFFGGYIGFYALSYSLIGFFCGKPFRDFFREHYFMPVLLTLGAALFNSAAFYVFNFLLRARLDFSYYLLKVILPESFYTSIISVILYKLVYSLNERLEEREKRNKPFLQDEGE